MPEAQSSARGTVRLGRRVLIATLSGLSLAASSPVEPKPPAPFRADSLRVYVGTYTSGDSKGIYSLDLDLRSGKLTPAGEPAAAINPSFLALHPSGRFLFAVNETGDARQDPSGKVSAYAIDPGSGALRLLNQQPSGGPAPCHLSVDNQGRYLLVANYWGGGVNVLPIGADGRLGPASAVLDANPGHGPNRERQDGAHAHAITLDAANRFALLSDLGLDRIFVYRFDGAKGTLAPHDGPRLAPGSGPRHLAFHPAGTFAYSLNELLSTISVFAYDASEGKLTERQSVPTLPEGYEGENLTAEVAVRPDGRFLYASNRGHDSIAIFAIDRTTGELTLAGRQSTLGKEPRNFAIDPSGRYLIAANQNSDTLVVFRIDAASGTLAAVGDPVGVPSPVCVLFARPPAGQR